MTEILAHLTFSNPCHSKEKLSLLCDELAASNKASLSIDEFKREVPDLVWHTTLSTTPPKEGVVFSVSGSMNSVMNCRAQLLRNNPSHVSVKIKACRNILLNGNGDLKPLVKISLDELKASTNTSISLVSSKGESKNQWSANTTISIDISGLQEGVERARMKLLVLLDELFGLVSTSMTIEPKLIPILAGKHRAEFEAIMRHTGTCIYQPASYLVQSTDVYSSTLYVTGKTQDIVQSVSSAIQDLIRLKTPKLISLQIPLMTRKIDWMFTEARDHVSKISKDNGVYLAFPPLGSSTPFITIWGCDSIYIQRTARMLMTMATRFYVAFIQLNQIADLPQRFLASVKELSPTFLKICKLTGAEIMFQRQFIEIYGTRQSVKKAYLLLTELEWIKNSIRDTKFQLELGLDHREFINGKKNGKVNRITKLSNCRVAFQETVNEYNMLIDLYSPVPFKALMGLEMLEDELPSEVSFCIPETYHKRIIGVAGKNIQKIMKKYGVYVKFSSAEEFKGLGGYYETSDNVIARTPAKNAENLRDLKVIICESVNAMDLIDAKATVTLARQLFSIVFGKVLGPLENHYGIKIVVPDRELGLDDHFVVGDASQVELAKVELQKYSRMVYDFVVLDSSSLRAAIESADFEGFVSMLQKDHDVHLSLHLADPSHPEATVYVIHPSHSKARLEGIKKLLIDFLAKHDVALNGVSRSESYANLQSQSSGYESFQHFNTKLLANTSSAPESNPTAAQNFSLFSDEAAARHNMRRSIFETEPSSLRRSGSELTDANLMGRPRNYSFGEHTFSNPPNPQIPHQVSQHGLNESTDFLRHAPLHRPALTMPDLMSIMDPSETQPDENRIYGRWGMPLEKSHSAAALFSDPRGSQKPPLRSSLSFAPTSSMDHQEEQDLEFDTNLVDQLIGLDTNDTTDMDRISFILESINHGKYLPLFIEHEIDYATFFTLEDSDLKELGIKALGTRKKIMAAIQEAKKRIFTSF